MAVGILAVLSLPFVLGSVRTSGRIIITADEVVSEDLYAFGDLVVVEGRIEGDLFAVASEVRISGTIEGDLNGLVGGPVSVSGAVEGAVRVAAIDVEITGTVGDDVAALTAEASLGGAISGDVIYIGGEARLAGSVGRDVRLQALRLIIDGDVGRDVLARVDTLTLGADAQVDGDLLYTAATGTSIADSASVGGQFIKRTVISPVWARAVMRALTVLSVAALIVGGLVSLWLFRSTSRQALIEVEERPGRSALVGTAFVIGLPLLAAPLFLTLVGIPVALFVLLAWLAALVLGPIPAVTHLGGVVLRGRGGATAGVVVGVLVWRGFMWLVPLVAGFAYLSALTIGVGAFARAGWTLRRTART